MFLFSNTQTGSKFNQPWDSILYLVLVILLKLQNTVYHYQFIAQRSIECSAGADVNK